jgi:hypothetical protein
LRGASAIGGRQGVSASIARLTANPKVRQRGQIEIDGLKVCEGPRIGETFVLIKSLFDIAVGRFITFKNARERRKCRLERGLGQD